MILKKSLSRFIRRSHIFPYFRLRTPKRFLTVRMDVTNKCNLRCRMCTMHLADMDPNRIWHDIDPDLFQRIRRDIFPRAAVVGLSCGAEPFCCDSLHVYLEELWKADVPITELVTNGTLMTKEMIDYLIDFPPMSLFISIDGCKPETHAAIRDGANLGQILENVQELQIAKKHRKQKFPQVCFSTTLQKGNYSEILGIVEIASNVGAVSVGVVPLVPYEGLDVDGLFVSLEDPNVQLALRKAQEKAIENGVDLVVPETAFKSESCPFIDSWIYIDPDGRIDPCPHWNISEPLGNLFNQSFEEIWSGRFYQELRDRHKIGDLSGNCLICPVMGSGSGIKIPKV